MQTLRRYSVGLSVCVWVVGVWSCKRTEEPRSFVLRGNWAVPVAPFPQKKASPPTTWRQKAQSQAAQTRVPVRYTLHPIHPQLRVQPQMEALIRPYREQLKKKMAEVITFSPRTLERIKPEGGLGNLVVDLALASLRHLGYKADLFISNLGGIRNDLAKGPVTHEDIFECLPFENKIVVVWVQGKQLQAIADVIARHGGEPVAGMRFVIDARSRRALHLYIGNQPLQPQRRYLLGSSDYLTSTGFLGPHLKGLRLIETQLLLRDAVMWGLKHTTLIQSVKRDGRIRIQ